MVNAHKQRSVFTHGDLRPDNIIVKIDHLDKILTKSDIRRASRNSIQRTK
jgi:hypothetical protein